MLLSRLKAVLASNTPGTFYRRYMNDWVWVFPKKRGLRHTLTQQYGVLQTLRVAMHPDKTFIGRVDKSFDFPGFHLSPTAVTVSGAASSRHEQKVAGLYKRGASKKRIRAHRLRWLAWVLAFTVAPSHAATNSSQCSAFPSLNWIYFGRNVDFFTVNDNPHQLVWRSCGVGPLCGPRNIEGGYGDSARYTVTRSSVSLGDFSYNTLDSLPAASWGKRSRAIYAR